MLTPKPWVSRSALASTPASANCSTATSAGSPSTSPRGSSGRPAPARSSSRAPCVTWSSAQARASRTAAASSCVACPAPGNCWRSIATARGRDRLRQNWRQCPLLAVGPRCAGRTAPWRRSRRAHRGFSAGWAASPRPPAADEQLESARFDHQILNDRDPLTTDQDFCATPGVFRAVAASDSSGVAGSGVSTSCLLTPARRPVEGLAEGYRYRPGAICAGQSGAPGRIRTCGTSVI